MVRYRQDLPQYILELDQRVAFYRRLGYEANPHSTELLSLLGAGLVPERR